MSSSSAGRAHAVQMRPSSPCADLNATESKDLTQVKQFCISEYKKFQDATITPKSNEANKMSRRTWSISSKDCYSITVTFYSYIWNKIGPEKGQR